MKELVIDIFRAVICFTPSFLAAFLLSGLFSAWMAVRKLNDPSFVENMTVRTGGVGILVGFLVSALVTLFFCKFYELTILCFFMQIIWLLIVTLPYYVLGLLDDIFHLTPVKKNFAFLFVVCLHYVPILFYYFFSTSYDRESWVFHLMFLYPVIIFAFSKCYNALGRIGGHCEMAFLGLWLAFLFADTSSDDFSTEICFLLSSAVFGLFVWNLYFKPRIRLGNAGGLFLGSCAALLASWIVLDYDAGLCYGVCLFLTLLAFPIYDACSVVLLRSKSYRDLSKSWHDHFAHRLLRGGFPLWAVNLITFAAAGVLPAVVLRLPHEFVFVGPVVIWVTLFCVDFFAYYASDRPLKTDSAD